MSAPEPAFDARSGGRVAVWIALAVDVVLVTAFAAIGRASHDSDVWTGLWQTAWPFLAALGIGWLVTRAWRAPAAPVRTGLGVWAITVAGGMLLRWVSGQGTALAFIMVASLTLLLALVGWRLIVAIVRRVRRR
ncbi:DUF3054 domain-containing protein [Microbacterium sp. NPDC056044]|uniref:DUF3054 domain-containing protein n=1 Tax=Microbacterium sp. NPDC056044 TaxID=3345690 RepID=UPI0035DB3DA3